MFLAKSLKVKHTGLLRNQFRLASTASTSTNAPVKRKYNPDVDLPDHLKNLKVMPAAVPFGFFLFSAIILAFFWGSFAEHILGIGKEEEEDE